MSLRIELPSFVKDQALNEAGLLRLRAAALGRDPSVPRGPAMALLAGQRNASIDLQSILEDENELPRFRVLAATLLWRLGSPAAQDILLRSTGIRDEQVLSAVSTALGRIGDERALEALRNAAGHATGTAVKQARFAAMLIEHRVGLANGGGLPPIDPARLTRPDATSRPFEIVLSVPEESAKALRSLAREPFGIEYASRPQQIHCGRNVWMLLFDRGWASAGPQRLIDRKALAGVLASRSEDKATYSVRFLILSAPAGGEAVRIMGFTTMGDLAFAGEAVAREASVEFTVTALSRPGAFPFRLEAAWQLDHVDVRRAVTGVFVQGRRQPMEGIRPSKHNS